MSPRVRPITEDDLPPVAEFLRRNMTSGVDAEAWSASLRPSWYPDPPNHGFMLVEGTTVVGVYAAHYARRTVRGRPEDFCGLGAWCVLPAYRPHGPRLLKALLAQPDLHFVDLSPSGSVIGINERLGFGYLDTATALVPVLPWPWRSRGGGVSDDPAVLERTLSDVELRLYRDHRNAAAAHHVLLTRGDDHCYLVFRRDRRRGSPRVFASLLHVGNADLLRRMWRSLGGYLLVRHRVLAVLVERQVVADRPPWSVPLRSQRRKMFRSPTLDAADIDYFYSELCALKW